MGKSILVLCFGAAFCLAAEAATRIDFTRALGRQYNDLRLEAITGLQQEELVGLSIRAGPVEKSCVVRVGGRGIAEVKAEIQRLRGELVGRPDSDFADLGQDGLEDLIRTSLVVPVNRLVQEKAELIRNCHKKDPITE